MNEQPEPSEEVEDDPPAPTPKGNRIRRWERTVPLALVSSALVVAAIWFFLPPAEKPTVAAKVHVASRINPQRQAARVKSRLVLNAALRDPKVIAADLSVLRDRDALAWLEQEIKVDFHSGPEILRVSMVGDQTEELVVLVNAVVDAYVREFGGNRDATLKARIENLEEILKAHQDRMKRLEQLQRVLDKSIFLAPDVIVPEAIVLRQERIQRSIAYEQNKLFRLNADLAQFLKRRHAPENVEQIKELKELIEGQKRTIATLEKAADVVTTRINRRGLNRESELARDSYRRVATTLDGLKKEQEAPPQVRVLESASVSRPDELPRKRFASIGAASTFALVLLLAAYLGFRSRLI